MTDVFVIRNQLGHYWGKSKSWVDGSEARAVLRARHHDEAVNTLFELSSRDVDLRGQVVAVELDARGEPMVEPSQIPLPVAAEADREDDAGQAAQADEGSATTQGAAAR